MPEETRAALDRAADTRSRIGKFTGVPDTWDGWATRILTVAVVILLGLSLQLFGTVRTVQSQLEDTQQLTINQTEFMNESRSQRTQFQREETTRQCEILRQVGRTTEAELRELGC